MNLIEVSINGSPDFKKGMVVIYNKRLDWRLLVTSNHKPYYPVVINGQKIPVSNHRRNKVMLRDFDNPNEEPWLGCFDLDANSPAAGYKAYVQELK